MSRRYYIDPVTQQRVYLPDYLTPIDGTLTQSGEAADAKATGDALAAKIPNPSGGIAGQVLKKTAEGVEWANESGGSSDFDELTNRPSYNGSAMTHSTNIPEVKTATWDGKYSKPSGGIPDSDIASAATWNAKGTYSKPSGGIPASDMASAVQTSLGKADSALQEHQSLAAYRTASAQDVIDSGKQATIADLETIRSGAALGATALQSVPNTYRTSSAQDVIDATKQDKPTAETYTIATASWSALASSTPYTYSATVTATHTIGANTVCKLINDNAVLFATYGFAIGAVSGQSVTIYSIGQPDASVTLEVDYIG